MYIQIKMLTTHTTYYYGKLKLAH